MTTLAATLSPIAPLAMTVTAHDVPALETALVAGVRLWTGPLDTPAMLAEAIGVPPSRIDAVLASSEPASLLRELLNEQEITGLRLESLLRHTALTAAQDGDAETARAAQAASDALLLLHNDAADGPEFPSGAQQGWGA